MSAWPATARAEMPALGDVLFCHATPRSDTEIFVRTTQEEKLRAIFEAPKVSLVVCGHTHMQFDRGIGDVRVVNAGSVGMPFGAPGANWLLLGPDVQLRHTRYDLDRAARRIHETEYPGAAESAERNVLSAPGEHEMLELFGRAELS